MIPLGGRYVVVRRGAPALICLVRSVRRGGLVLVVDRLVLRGSAAATAAAVIVVVIIVIRLGVRLRGRSWIRIRLDRLILNFLTTNGCAITEAADIFFVVIAEATARA